ncbi:hypothetical protein LSTR_LSTR014241 [Laodelphax striatellus]|uniref:Ubiquitin carboxyl-terminal hydrolase n=1 Tax=Laodelphax striatellus TaxID=195883 RepID=A0A482WNT8_LAOST|nr:hypothetical protein LSTR_LSTR014241 [Laodelphax striatellus]
MDRNPLRVVAKLLSNAQKPRKRKWEPEEKMPEKEWVDLYMCRCMEDLKSRSDMGDMQKRFGTCQQIQLVDSLRTLIKAAEESEKKRDMESAYIYLYRFLELIVFIKTKKNTDQKFIKMMFGTEVNKGINRLHELTNQLEIRYKKKMEDRGDNLPSKISPRSETSLDNENDDIEEKRLKKSEKETIRDINNKVTTSGAITPFQLKNYAKDGRTIAIFDVRSPEWFKKSRINLDGVKIISIPNETTPSKIGKILESDANAWDVWNSRKSFDLVVIVDDAADTTTLESSAAGKLQKTLREYDYLVEYKYLKYLEGGFREWHHNYPTLCTKATFIDFIRTTVSSTGDIQLLDQIKYPTIEEPASVHKTIKSPSTNETSTTTLDNNTAPAPSATSKTVPTINRQIKPSIGKSIQKPAESLNQNGHADKEEVNTDEIPDKENIEPESRDGLKPAKSNNIIIVDRSTKPTVPKPAQNVEGDRSQITKQIPSRYPLSMSPLSQPKRSASSINLTSILCKFHNLCSNVLSNDEWNRSGSGTTFEPLKSDSSSSTSNMKRSSSFPNISKLVDDDEEVSSVGGVGGAGVGVGGVIPPKYDRSAKPVTSFLPSPQLKPHEAGIYSSNITPGLTGLKNLGNTCYMNSIVQCLSNTDQLRRQMCAFDPAAGRRTTGHGASIALEMDKVVRKLWAGKHKNFPCDELKNVVGKLKASFRGYEQQDSHEFLTILLDWLHEELNKPDEFRELSGADEASGERAWGEFRRKNNSIVADLFYGQLKSTVTCQTCAKMSVTFEPFSNLSLPLSANHNPLAQDRCSLDDCLELYLSKESIAGWNCPNCKTARAATKKIDISRLPPILVIHLKRFTSNGARKKQTLVEFPVERLDMVRYATPGSEQRNRNYHLYAVSNHYGTMESGHYTAYCLNPDLNRWYEFNDTEVLEMQDHNVHTSAAYILFYKAIDR